MKTMTGHYVTFLVLFIAIIVFISSIFFVRNLYIDGELTPVTFTIFLHFVFIFN